MLFKSTCIFYFQTMGNTERTMDPCPLWFESSGKLSHSSPLPAPLSVFVLQTISERSFSPSMSAHRCSLGTRTSFHKTNILAS